MRVLYNNNDEWTWNDRESKARWLSTTGMRDDTRTTGMRVDWSKRADERGMKFGAKIQVNPSLKMIHIELGFIVHMSVTHRNIGSEGVNESLNIIVNFSLLLSIDP